MSTSLEAADINSSSESISLEAVVTGVGGAASGPAEARILLFGTEGAEDIVASAAFRFRVVGGIVSDSSGQQLKLLQQAASVDDATRIER